MPIALDRSPCFAGADSADGGLVNSVVFTQRVLAQTRRANSANIICGQPCRVMRFAFGRIVAFTLGSICRVFFRSSKSKMSRVTANSIVATVQHENAFRWDRLVISNSPRYAMRFVCLAGNLKSAVSIAATSWPFPWMATVWIRSIDSRLKSQQERHGSRLNAARMRATGLGRLARGDIKFSSAMTLPPRDNLSYHHRYFIPLEAR